MQAITEPAKQAVAAKTTNKSSHPHNLSLYRTNNLRETAIALKHCDLCQPMLMSTALRILTRKVTTTPMIVSGLLATGMWESCGAVGSTPGNDDILD